MPNRDTRATWAYHDATKHSQLSVWSSTHRLDWSNQPLPYKIYASLEPIPLPRTLLDSAPPALVAIGVNQLDGSTEYVPNLLDLARLCHYANGVTRWIRYRGGDLAFRAAGTTGALYHIELYVVCADLPDLPAGLYHYAAHDHALRRLRTSDLRGALVEATGHEPSVVAAPLAIILTSTFWRNSWKYQARAYRHSFWDGGTVLANLLAVASAAGLPHRVVLGFDDTQMNQLVDVDSQHEASISLVAIGRTGRKPPPAPALDPLKLPTRPLSRFEVPEPAISAMHTASSLASGAEVATWRAMPPQTPSQPPRAVGQTIAPRPLRPEQYPAEPLEVVIRRRGSTRRFSRRSITFEQLSILLEIARRPIPIDCLPDGVALADVYVIVNGVDGLLPGAYVLHPATGSIELLRAGDFRDAAGLLDLGQALAADAAVNMYYLTELQPVLARFGNRGYRVAQLSAAISAGRVWLAAYALRLGATGLTFFDDDVTRFFSPHAAGKGVMFLLAVGHPAPRR